MTQISTSLRNTVDNARRIRYEPSLPFTATNVQDAIQQIHSVPVVLAPTAVTHSMSPYTPTNSDFTLLLDTSAGAITINLQAQAARTGFDLTVKDNTGNAAANPISVVPNGAETIDGLAPYPIDSNFGAVTLSPQSGGYFVRP